MKKKKVGPFLFYSVSLKMIANIIIIIISISIILIVILPASNYSEVLVIVTKWKFNGRNQWKRPDEGALHLSYSEILFRL